MRMIKVVFGLVFSITLMFANPILITYIHEVQAAPDSLERIELHDSFFPSGTTNLSGWTITTRAGTATINAGVILQDSNYVIIDATNTTGILHIDEISDTILLRNSSGYSIDLVFWPSLPAGMGGRAPAPPYGGSISLYRAPYNFYDTNQINWYVDSTPTFGMINDNWSSISGRVLNSQGQPMLNHYIIARGPTGSSSGLTDALGYYTVGGLGQGKYWLTVNYQYNPPIGNYPDSIYVGYSQNISNININLPFVGIEQNDISSSIDKLISVQSPIRTNSKISFILPYENEVLVKLYDTKGSLLRTLLNQKLSAGQHQIELNTILHPGVYFLNVDFGKQKMTKKIISVN